MSIRLPRLLDANLKERARLQPLKLALDLMLQPISTAELRLPPDAPQAAVRDFIELYDENGSAGVFRVAGLEQESGGAAELHLEHGIATLSDSIVPAMSFTGTVRDGYQNDVRWMLGDVEVDESAAVLFTCGCENLLTALRALMDLLPAGLCWEYDQSGPVWVLHVRRLCDEDACEGRLSRNLSSVRIVMDGSDLCTRVYPYGAGQGTDRIDLTGLTGEKYLQSEAASTWGVISRTFTAGNIFDAPTLREVALKYLERHGEPTVSVTAQAIDLSRITGESADSFRLGRMCRLALPEEGVTLHERVVGIRKPDVFGTPGYAVLTLCNRLQDASDEIAGMLREVTADRLMGGQLSEVTTHSRANGTATSRIEHYFRVESVAAVLSCMVSFDADDGVQVVGIAMDNNDIPASVYQSGHFDAIAYLKRDENGVITTGRHTLAIYPDSGAVNSTVTLKVIQGV